MVTTNQKIYEKQRKGNQSILLQKIISSQMKTRGRKEQGNYKEEKYKMALESPYLLRDINNYFISCK